jgi:MFS family permease
MVLSLTLAALTLSGVVKVEHIIVLGFLAGCAMAIDIPARHSFVLNMVGNRKEVLTNAIALNSLMFNSARLIGPAIAGVFIAIVGEGTCFLVNGLSFIAVIASLLVMNVDSSVQAPRKTGAMKDLKEGFRYTFGFEPIRAVLVLLGMISLMGMSYVVLMPVMAKNILGGGPGTLGALMSSAGFGALAATFFLASRRAAVKIGYMLPAASGLFAFGIMGLAFSRSMWTAVPLLAISGFGFMTHMAVSNIVLQTISDDDKRGRVMSFYSMAVVGMAPLGSLLAGILASWIGTPNALFAGACFCLIASLFFARRVPDLQLKARHIFDKMASPPVVASGIATASELSVPPED